MSLWRFVLPVEHAAVRHHLGGVLRLLGLLLGLPLVVALAGAELPQAGVFAATAGGCLLLGALARRGDEHDLPGREALIVTALAYLLFALVGAIVLLPVAAPVDAFFEAMSGFTTTGLSVMEEDALPRSVLFFRSYAQWIGGGGIIVLSLVVLATPGGAASRLYASEFGQENLRGSVVATGRVVLVIYAALTALAYLALLGAGAGVFDALVHALALVSTGGFSAFPDSIGAYGSAAVATVTAVFMLLGAVSFPLYYWAVRGGWRRIAADAQLWALLALLATGSLVALAFENVTGGASVIFHVASAVTTTGFTVDAPGDWAEGTRLLTVALMVVGGSLGSTAGGLKLLRVLILARLAWWALTRIILPREAAIPLKIGGATVNDDELRGAIAFAVLYAAVAFTGALALTTLGVGAQDALFESVSALSTVGLSVGVTGPDLPAWAKLLLSFNMWVGRLEILPVLVLLQSATPSRDWTGNAHGRRHDAGDHRGGR